MNSRNFYPPSSILYLLLLFPASGCNIIGAVAGKVAGGETITAKYLPPKTPMVVIVENWRNPAGSATDADQLARFVYHELRMHEIAPQVDPLPVFDLKNRSAEDFRKLTIAQIGQRVGAQQVLYINVTASALAGPQASDSVRGTLSARVKIVDVTSGESRWPTDAADGYPITVQTPMADAKTDNDEAALRQSLQQRAAVAIVHLFYTAQAEE